MIRAKVVEEGDTGSGGCADSTLALVRWLYRCRLVKAGGPVHLLSQLPGLVKRRFANGIDRGGARCGKGVPFVGRRDMAELPPERRLGAQKTRGSVGLAHGLSDAGELDEAVALAPERALLLSQAQRFDL